MKYYIMQLFQIVFEFLNTSLLICRHKEVLLETLSKVAIGVYIWNSEGYILVTMHGIKKCSKSTGNA